MAVGSYLARWESGRIQFYKEDSVGRVPISYAKKQEGILGKEPH